MQQNQTEKLVLLPNGCWQIANDSRSLFAADFFFDRFPQLVNGKHALWSVVETTD